MAYEKRTWVSGTTPLSAENMNHMEGGIAAANEGVDKLNTDLKNSEITVNRTNQVWIAKSYTEYVVCEYTIQSAGVYLAVAKTMLNDYKTDRAFDFELNQNSSGNGPGIVLQSNGAYGILAPMSYIFTCAAGDKIYTTAQTNYVADGEAYAGLATGYLKLIKLHS